jgi:hypothetical protein
MKLKSFLKLFVPYGIIKNKSKIVEFLKCFVPYGIIHFRDEYRNAKKEIKHGSNKYNADIIISCGKACSTAEYLKQNKLRYMSSPLDWMMCYSLDAVLHFFKTKFNDFFVEISVDETKTKPKYQHKWVKDIGNDIVSIHHFRWHEEIENEKRLFLRQMRIRYKRLDFIMRHSKSIMFISNRNEVTADIAGDFLKQMFKIYKKKIIFLNIVNIPPPPIGEEIVEKQTIISNKLKYVELQFNDTHPDGDNPDTNPDYYWLGNTEIWKSIMNDISLTYRSLLLYTIYKMRFFEM